MLKHIFRVLRRFCLFLIEILRIKSNSYFEFVTLQKYTFD